MTDKSHIAMNVMTIGVFAETEFAIVHTNHVSMHSSNIVKSISDYLLDNQSLPVVVFAIISVLLFILGSILPDIDHPNSMIGRIVCIPVKHRTWTHSIWLVILLGVIGIKFRYVMWCAIGVLLHDFWDAFSMSGLSFFYPLKNKHHVLKLYHTGQFSEYLIVVIQVAFFIIYTFITMQMVYHFVNISF